MSTAEDSRRFASDTSGVIHEVVDFNPRREVYVSMCEIEVPARSAEVWRAEEVPGLLCRACQTAVQRANGGVRN